MLMIYKCWACLLMAGDEEIDLGEYTTFLELFGVSTEDCCNAFQLFSGVPIYLYIVKTRGCILI